MVNSDVMPVANIERAWAALHQVLDPEVPALSICDLGIVRDVVENERGLEVVLTPTYSGCPATEVIAQNVHDALGLAGLGNVTVTYRKAPAWTTDWISAAGRQKLHDYGIAPPGHASNSINTAINTAISIRPRGINCPRCNNPQTERLSAFGSTACKALYRCLVCREPFEYFKPI